MVLLTPPLSFTPWRRQTLPSQFSVRWGQPYRFPGCFPTTRSVTTFLTPVSLSPVLKNNQKTPAIPAITGSNGIVSSYLAALHILSHANAVIQDGYVKYREGVFRIPMLFRWEYVASGARHILEIAAAPEHILSFQAGVAEVRSINLPAAVIQR